ncbi:M15 family metallopeptidase [Sulfurovum sp. ST-21]|uniref:M15 family metallopeptidase n=1 Tax=Sulfurovum indicum TaxID=2779528 RepID=A0A7M1S2D8_9BACT|nr:M15 family metallopeptidase [Sulfurovum indicum]QOR61538.1 M15 family metallopeptidase [Sulfurovum indicum]
MKYLLLMFLMSPMMLFAQYRSLVSPVSEKIRQRMVKGDSWREGCPVHYRDLRYLQMTYRDFKGKEHIGEMIVHKEVAVEVMEIFRQLYEAGYPVRRMRLVSDFGGSDWQSIEADNTSAFNCRKATGSRKWSKHAYGKAIDLNPIENPYISRNGHIAHKKSLQFWKRVHKNHTPADRAVLLKHDNAVKIFRSYGWKWGGEWHRVKDYQHFSK